MKMSQVKVTCKDGKTLCCNAEVFLMYLGNELVKNQLTERLNEKVINISAPFTSTTMEYIISCMIGIQTPRRGNMNHEELGRACSVLGVNIDYS